MSMQFIKSLAFFFFSDISSHLILNEFIYNFWTEEESKDESGKGSHRRAKGDIFKDIKNKKYIP